ncbi:MAG: iron chelate uptake ABC transporter family permease subunit [Akkermansia sp.]
MNDILEVLGEYTFQTVALGSLLLGLISGLVGSFVVLRKQGLLGDAISHSTLPGIALVFLMTGHKDTELLLLGAGIAGLLAMLAILNITKYTRVKFDAALALVFSVFFGVGMVLMTAIQKLPNASQAGLDRFVLGQAATMMRSDLQIMLVCAIILLVLSLMFWKELKLFIFDVDFARSVGFSSKFLNTLLSLMIVMGIVVGLQTVGAILMCAMLICPAVAARQWTNRFGRMVALSAALAAIAGVTGTLISSLVSKMPTGPLIVVVMSCITFISMLIAPSRGVLAKMLQHHRNKSNFASMKGELEA